VEPAEHLDPDTLAAYVDGRLPAVDLGRADRHIDACASCRVELSALAATASQPRATSAATGAPESATIGRYHVLREIGRGAMGIVLRAYDPELARPVALKLLRGDSLDAADRELLRREARALAKLRHPNVVSVYDAFTEGESFYIAMELVEGETLRAFAKAAGTEGMRQVLNACVAAGRGLAAAHDAGIVHRDFKPENVLCTDKGDVRVSDFGLARTADDEDKVFAGTPAYMAPEVLARKPATAESDQYSFCVTLYELVEGSRPETETLLESGSPHQTIVDKRVDAEAPKEWSAPTNMPSWVWRVVRRGLSADPVKRWPSMHALIEALANDPAVRRRRQASLAVGALAAVSVGALAMRFVGSGADTCDVSKASLGDAWDGARQSNVAVAVRKASDDDNATRVVDALNRHTARWLDARRAACSQRGEAKRVTPQLACMERTRRELGELTAMLANADRVVAARALEGIGKLRDPSACGSETAAADVLAASAADIAAAERARVMLDRAAALLYVGKLDESQALAHSVAWTAKEPRLIAEAKLIEGRIENERSRPEKAEPVLFEGLQAAERAHDDTLAASAWCEIVMATGAQGHRFELALSNMKAADAALARIVPGSVLQVRYDYTVGTMLLAHGKIDDARTRLKLGLEHAGSEEQWRVQVGLLEMALCDVERQASKPQLARAHCERGMHELEAVLGKEHLRVGISLSIVGSLAFGERDMATAETAYKRAIAIFEKHDARDHLAYALAQSNLGAVYASRTDVEHARAQFEAALALFDKYHPGHPQRMFALQGLAGLATRTGDVEAAIARYTEVRDGMAAAYTAESQQVMTADYNLAVAYTNAGRLEDAEAILATLIDRALVPGKEQWTIAARALDLSAATAERRKEFATTLKLRERALAALSNGGPAAERALALRNLGMTQLKMSKFKDSLATFEQALKLQESSREDPYDRGRARFGIALSLEGLRREHARAIALVKQARDDFAKAQGGEALKFYRDASERFLRDAAKNP
jgi:tetratricopeptide (TPR) repeat protein/predicted Ser/Thr protein kinase